MKPSLILQGLESPISFLCYTAAQVHRHLFLLVDSELQYSDRIIALGVAPVLSIVPERGRPQ